LRPSVRGRLPKKVPDDKLILWNLTNRATLIRKMTDDNTFQSIKIKRKVGNYNSIGKRVEDSLLF